MIKKYEKKIANQKGKIHRLMKRYSPKRGRLRRRYGGEIHRLIKHHYSSKKEQLERELKEMDENSHE
jgi:hypothetical protein